MAGLRPFCESDIPPVADLIWRVLHEHNTAAPASLHTHLNDLFFHNPWAEEGMVSRVLEDAQGKITGFFGAVPRRMTVQEKTIRIAFGSNFVMDPTGRTVLAAIQLVKAFLKGPQDVSMTDSANEASRQLLRSLGFSVVPIYSLQWARPLRPARYATHAISRLKKSGGARMAASLARPASIIADAMASGMKMSPFRQSRPATADEELDSTTLLQCLNTIPSKHWLLPEYDQNSLNWIFEFIAKRKVYGDLRKCLVRDKDRKIIGWYIYSGGRGEVGEVLQIGAESPSIGVVLDHLFYDAWQLGLIALHGRMEPQFMQELTARACFFFRHGSWTLVHSKNSELMAMIQSGSAFFSRLDGEWCLRHGGLETTSDLRR
jgi:hypothetical protein